MRIDKFLKVSRIIKRRTVANEACDAGRVSLNGKVVKAGAAGIHKKRGRRRHVPRGMIPQKQTPQPGCGVSFSLTFCF